MAGIDPSHSPLELEKQFEDFRVQLEESGSLRDRIRAVAVEIDSTTRRMQAGLLLVHQSRPIPEILEKSKAQIDILKDLYSKLAEVVRESPGHYYRYHGDWRSETQTVVSLLAFMHWLETGSLLMHTEAEEKLGLTNSDFALDVEDYLVGLCFMSNEMPRYVVNQVTAGYYDCPRNVLEFLTELHASFRLLNLRNDFLRKKFDSLKYDLRRVEEVFYDVKIRGLSANVGAAQEKEVLSTPVMMMVHAFEFYLEFRTTREARPLVVFYPFRTLYFTGKELWFPCDSYLAVN
ncbi:hypothetical protein ACFE04_003504 [Oxalis oulophora]